MQIVICIIIIMAIIFSYSIIFLLYISYVKQQQMSVFDKFGLVSAKFMLAGIKTVS